MLYLVRTVFSAPPEIDSASLAKLRDAESAAAGLLQQRGRILHLWRDMECGAAWGVWDIPDGESLATYQAELPCYPYMTVESHPITRHPNFLDNH